MQNNFVHYFAGLDTQYKETLHQPHPPKKKNVWTGRSIVQADLIKLIFLHGKRLLYTLEMFNSWIYNF